MQFTSGSTGLPRGVCLSRRAVLAGLRAIAESAALTADDTPLSSLPGADSVRVPRVVAALERDLGVR